MVNNPTRTANLKVQQRWRNAVDKFRHTLGDSVDTVRVRISVDSDYLQEIATGKLSKEFLGSTYEFPMLQMETKQLMEHQIIYDKSKNALLDYHNNYATTLGKQSKGLENQQAFVMAKDGSLYIGTHEGQPIDPENPNLSHASFLKGKPAEMAGMINITDQGKIDLITNDSGHYAPEPLDMYRGIKKIPMEAFTQNAKIAFHDGSSMTINNFIQDMEQITNEKAKHQQLRDQRINKLKEYEKNLKNAVSIRFDAHTNDVISAITNLNTEQQKELSIGLANPMVNISISDAQGKYQNIKLGELIDDIVYDNKISSMNVLLNAGVTNRDWSHEANPLHKAVTQQREEMVKEMLANHNTQKFLAKEETFPEMNTLHIAASGGNIKIIEELLKYPEGRNLLTKKDQHGLTPLDSAKRFKHIKAIDILTKAEQKQKFEKILNNKQLQGTKKLFKHISTNTNTPIPSKKKKDSLQI